MQLSDSATLVQIILNPIKVQGNYCNQNKQISALEYQTFSIATISITSGIFQIPLFEIDASGLLPALIKFDQNPTGNPTGYDTYEIINFITADIKVTRIASNLGKIEGTIYGYNNTDQVLFGTASRFLQKIWHLKTEISNPTNFTIIAATAPDSGGGASVNMTNILRYNTTL